MTPGSPFLLIEGGRSNLPNFSLDLRLDFLHYSVTNFYLIDGDVVPPHSFGIAPERYGCIVVAHPCHPGLGHRSPSKIVELELLCLRMRLKVFPGLLLQP